MATTKKTAAPKKAVAAKKPAIGMSHRKVASTEPTDKLEAAARRTQRSGKQATRRLSEKTIEKIVGTVTKQAATPGLPVHEVTTTEQLRVVLAEFPTSNSFTTDRKFGKDIITIVNMRGRAVAEVHVIPKKAKK